MVQLICGILRLDGAAADERCVQSMLEAMRPAGTASSHATAIEGPIGLGIVTIAAHPYQPPEPPAIVRGEVGLCVADARLYDTASSRHGELLTTLFERDGLGGLARANGDFALAHWNRSEGRLTLARDRFGVRPLQYVVRAGAHVAFASLPQALLRTGLASRALDEPSVAGFPVNMQPLPGRTFFREIASARAAHVVVIDRRGHIASTRYWRLPLEPRLPFDTDPMAAAAEIRRLLEQAVKRRLPARGTVASHMSGGLDSTPIAVLAARAVRGEGRACLGYSFRERGVDDDPSIIDEAPYVDETAAREPNLSVVPVYLDSDFDVLRAGIDADTMLPLSPSEPEETVLRHAAAAGVDVMLSGWGGDQVVTSFGAGWDSELLLAGRWRQLMHMLRAQGLRNGRSPIRQIAAIAIRTLVPTRLLPFYQRLRGQHPWLRSARFASARARRLARYETRLRHPDSRANRRAEFEAWWIPYRLELFAQQGARHGVSYAYPMLDHDLIAYAMRLPGVAYRNDGVTRRLIRDAIADLVPDSVRWREEKLAPFPIEDLRVSRQRDELIAFAETLGAHPMVARYIDIENVVAHLRGLPGEDEIRRQIEEGAARGSQWTVDGEDCSYALQLASFLKAQDDARGERP